MWEWGLGVTQTAHWLQRVGLGETEGGEEGATWLSQTELMFPWPGLGFLARLLPADRSCAERGRMPDVTVWPGEGEPEITPGCVLAIPVGAVWLSVEVGVQGRKDSMRVQLEPPNSSHFSGVLGLQGSRLAALVTFQVPRMPRGDPEMTL